MNAPSKPTTTAPARGAPASTAPAQAGAKAEGGLIPAPKQGIVRAFAARLNVDPEKLLKILKDTAFKQPRKDGQPGPEVTDEQCFALLVVANEYRLNPFLKEIYAFPAKGGGIVPIIGIDGWIRMVNERPELVSIEFEYPEASTPKEDYYVTCIITRKDRAAPMRITEYFAECYRDTDAWRDTGRRMNRHRAFIQCARLAFGYGGVFDPDEGERVLKAMNQTYDSTATEVKGKPETVTPQAKVAADPAPEQGPKAPAEARVAAGAGAKTGMSDLELVKNLLNSTGVPENELFAQYEVGGFEELTPAMLTDAIAWLQRINKP
jgi:RecT family